MTKKGLIFVAFVLVVSTSLVATQERTWTKFHEVIRDADGNAVAEYTHVFTNDQGTPKVGRTLLRTQSGKNVVLRSSVETDGSGFLSIELLSTGEILKVDIHGDRVVSFGENSFTFTAEEEGSSGVRQQGQALLADASQGFHDALREIALVGSQYVPMVHNAAYILGVVLYDDITVVGGAAGQTDGFTGVVKDFDPQQNPPDAFDQAFGQAYYE